MSDDRRSVKTYVPAEQKDRWQGHADELGMSQSEFVRTMVQAGRRGFSIGGSEKAAEPDPSGSDPEGNDLETRVEAALSEEPLSWEELVEAVVGDFEDQLEETLDALQDHNRIRYNGRKGGYTLVDE
ncbi:DUF5805 domain-containing protein [Halorubrum yunnanense]|uniref:DUF5805 domain-containing protein n=1 Tax=Halorubrum yunnanense TaxID=1526162 RepID=A0ABD5YGE4_9EURY|nr:DUF5805 domain-containing protein [Halorubrum yunnanense]